MNNEKNSSDDQSNSNQIQLDETTKYSIISMFNQPDLRPLRNLPLETYDLNYLLEHNDIQFDKLVSPLLAACYVGKIEIVSLILNNDNLDVNLSSEPENYSPIMVACFKGYYEIVRILLDNNADVNKCNLLNQTPLLFCFSRIEEHRYKYENKKICTMMIDLLLSKGADINVRIDQRIGYTVLMKLASTDIRDKEQYENIIEIIKFLLERGASREIQGFDNKTVYDIVKVSNFQKDLIKVLNLTKQTIFYNNEKNSPIKGQKRGIIHELQIQDNTMKFSCCVIY